MSGERKPTRTVMKRQLRSLARQFADDLFELLNQAGFWDDRRQPVDNGNERVRRSTGALRSVADAIVQDLKGRKDSAAISAVARSLSLTARDIAHPMSLLVSEGSVVQKGERRGARYHLKRRRKPAVTKKNEARKRS